MDIEDYRDLIDKLDAAILAALSARMKLMPAIAEAKRNAGQPVFDSSEDNELIFDRLKNAAALDLDSHMVEKIFGLIIEEARSQK